MNLDGLLQGVYVSSEEETSAKSRNYHRNSGPTRHQRITLPGRGIFEWSRAAGMPNIQQSLPEHAFMRY